MNSDEFTLEWNIVDIPIINSKHVISEVFTHKSGRVVVPDGLGIPKGLQSRIGLDDLILQGTLI